MYLIKLKMFTFVPTTTRLNGERPEIWDHTDLGKISDPFIDIETKLSYINMVVTSIYFRALSVL